ncbi:MAG TPA: hypothetical protein VEQ59_25435, partial [Polyangiaceae bacterium]|nr:hypothetical protein [Polyangiaceae bacterium]
AELDAAPEQLREQLSPLARKALIKVRDELASAESCLSDLGKSRSRRSPPHESGTHRLSSSQDDLPSGAPLTRNETTR